MLMNSFSPLPPIPGNEQARLRALRRYGILDTAAESSFDALTALAAQLFGVPTVLVSLVDDTRQWFKSRIGMEACETGRNESFCAWALVEDDILEVLDPRNDPRFAHNPLVLGETQVSYYAGAPLRSPDGMVLGTLCLMDRQERPPLTPSQRQTLRTLAGAVMSEMNHHAARLHAELALMAANELELLSQERLGALAESIKSPLTSVLGYSQLVQTVGGRHGAEGLSAKDSDKLVAYAQSIQQAGQSLLELVNVSLEPMRHSDHDDGRDYSDLHLLLDEVHTLTAPLAEGREMTVRLHLTRSQPVQVDRVRLKRIVLALVSNALRHAGRGVIDLLAERDVLSGMVRLTIRDQGPGMPESAQRLLTGPEMIVPSLSTGNRGGLTLVRTLCHMMDLDLTTEVVPGIGSAIHIRLPCPAHHRA